MNQNFKIPKPIGTSRMLLMWVVITILLLSEQQAAFTVQAICIVIAVVENLVED